MNHALEKKALDLDAKDPLKHLRERFALPEGKIYFCNHSLGLPPFGAFTAMQEQLNRWADLGVEGWFQGDNNWYTALDAALRKPLSHLLGANCEEVIVMNSLTVNLHLLLVSFYQPTQARYKILIESPTFPSDLYAVKSHLHTHKLDPDNALIIVEPREGESLLRLEDIEAILDREGETIALVFFSSVNFLTGQVLDMKRIAHLAKSKGCLVGFDIAHAAGNIPLELHEWSVDFAVGCSYKYLCSGPGGPGIAYVHSCHHGRALLRLSGWWGNDPKTRFQMHLEPEFIPYDGAYSWQVSTPSVLAMTPFLASLKIFEEVGIHNVRKKSQQQTAFLLELLQKIPAAHFTIVTPQSSEGRGSQITLIIHQGSKKCLQSLEKSGIICDFRPPNMLRIAPSPLYNTFYEIYQFVHSLSEVLCSSSL